MKVLLFIALLLLSSLLLALGSGPSSGGSQPNPIASLLPFALMALVVYLVVRRSRHRSKRSDLTEAHRQRPPTDRQMAFIDHLMQEREVETWMLEKEPETIQEASELIDKLKKLPIRSGDIP